MRGVETDGLMALFGRAPSRGRALSRASSRSSASSRSTSRASSYRSVSRGASRGASQSRPQSRLAVASAAAQFARNADGGIATNFATLEPIPTAHAVRIGAHVFDERSLARLFASKANPVNPYTFQPFPAAVRNRVAAVTRRMAGDETLAALNRRRAAEKNLAARRRARLDYEDVLDELRNKTRNRYARTSSRGR
jgi:hypothetical protein